MITYTKLMDAEDIGCLDVYSERELGVYYDDVLNSIEIVYFNIDDKSDILFKASLLMEDSKGVSYFSKITRDIELLMAIAPYVNACIDKYEKLFVYKAYRKLKKENNELKHLVKTTTYQMGKPLE